MKKSKFTQYYDQQLASLRRHFRNTLKNGTKEDVHKLRVSLKKLNTLWSLLEVASGGHWKSKPCLDLWKPVFKAAGELRETQVNQHLLASFPGDSPGALPDQLKNDQKRLGKRLIRSMQAFDRKKFDSINRQLRRSMRGLPDETVLQALVASAVKNSKKVQALLEQVPDSRNLHKIRIRQKAVQEILAVLMKLYPDDSIASLHHQIKALNARIGSWHDSSVLLETLGRFKQREPGKKNMRPLNSLIQSLGHQQEAEQKELFRLLDKEVIGQQLLQLENLQVV